MREGSLPAVFYGAILVALTGAAVFSAEAPDGKGKAMAIKLTSAAFAEGQPIPVKYTGQGEDISPALLWSEIPPGTKSLALICDDPDAPVGTWVHWVIWNIPPETPGLAEAVPQKAELPSGARQGMNDFRKMGYGGPMPPAGNAHRYYFKIYALDIQPDLKSGAMKEKLLAAMKGHILAEGQLMGTYQRQTGGRP